MAIQSCPLISQTVPQHSPFQQTHSLQGWGLCPSGLAQSHLSTLGGAGIQQGFKTTMLRKETITGALLQG